MFKDKVLLITGGTGSFGNAVLRGFLDTDIKEIRIFSRDEKKQDDMRKQYNNDKLKFYLGDVRDVNSIIDVVRGVDFIFHAAAIQAGLIPLISDQTPWNDLEKYNAGRALKLSDKESFISAIKDTISMDNDSFKEISNNVIKYIEIKLDNNKSIEMYKKMFEDVVNKDEKL